MGHQWVVNKKNSIFSEFKHKWFFNIPIKHCFCSEVVFLSYYSVTLKKICTPVVNIISLQTLVWKFGIFIEADVIKIHSNICWKNIKFTLINWLHNLNSCILVMAFFFLVFVTNFLVEKCLKYLMKRMK